MAGHLAHLSAAAHATLPACCWCLFSYGNQTENGLVIIYGDKDPYNIDSGNDLLIDDKKTTIWSNYDAL